MYDELSNVFLVLLISIVAATTSALLTVKPYAVVVIVIVLIEKPNRKRTAIYGAMNIKCLMIPNLRFIRQH
jgi:hypothetical protein